MWFFHIPFSFYYQILQKYDAYFQNSIKDTVLILKEKIN